MSMVAAQEGGMAKSLKKLAMEIAITAALASCMKVVTSSDAQAPVYPKLATMRRVRSTLLVQRRRRSPRTTLTGFPNPPMNNGRTPNMAAWATSIPRASRRYVGSQVMLKYQPYDKKKYCQHSSHTRPELTSFAQGTRE